MNRSSIFPAFAVILSSLAPNALHGRVPDQIEFNRDVRPILSDNCFYCHGPDGGHREADLRLDLRDEAISGNAIFPGSAGDSELIARIVTDDVDSLMPPPASHKKLTAEQKEILKRWVDQGAVYQQHWAYEPPVKPEVPAGKHPVDHLVQSRLSEIGLTPSPIADDRTLVRRLYFDLIGLPPTADQVAAFSQASHDQSSSESAYTSLVDQLLKSPHYGERMAMNWLDQVRFADTIGYHSDNPHNVWPYRDYVIQSFNSNKPFDRFTIEQIAGDLLPDANLETRVGSAFNRLLLTTEEGGAQPKDYEQRMLTDRVRAVGNAWMGQTTGCAQCHDHKFDPITMRDFYQLGAFFADIKESLIGRREPGIMVLDPDDESKLAAINTSLETLRAEFAKPYPELAADQTAWEEQTLAAVTRAGDWQSHKPLTAVSKNKNVTLKIGKEGVVHGVIDKKRDERKQNDGTEIYTLTAKLPQGTTGIRIDALKAKSPGIGLASNGNFVLNEIVATLAGDDPPKPVAITHATASFEQNTFPAAHAVDGVIDQKSNGWAVLGGTGTDQSLYLELATPLSEPESLVTFTLTFGWGDNHEMANLRLNSTTAPAPIRAPATGPAAPEIVEILKIASQERTPPQQQKLVDAYKQIAPALADLRSKIATVEKEKADFEAAAPRCIVSESDSKKRTVRILPRGDWMNESGEIVTAAFPSYLPQPTIEGRELTRLDLAQWLVAKDNPLTARNVMNRLWKQFFGVGLSKVLDDLGAQGEPPVNAALLDWLACEFMDSGWDMQHMIKLIVTSDAYRQVSSSTPELTAADPYNRETARQSAFRLDAELVRDNALSVSGLMVAHIGGPSVKPYQPEGYWENLNFPTRTWQADAGEGLYRRGLYTWWQRSFVHPSLLAFDAPSREECTAERNRSNIPQQALVLLNDPTYVEAARAFAARILSECDGDVSQRIEWAVQQSLQRQPTSAEATILAELLASHLADYEKDPAAAEALLRTGAGPISQTISKSELAAWTHVARVLLNLHETITRS